MNSSGAIRPRVIRAYRTTVGASDGNIIAAIITTHTPRNQPSVPRAVHGPSSMPSIRSTVHHQPIAARTNSSATSHSRARAATIAGAGPAVRAVVEMITPPRRTST